MLILERERGGNKKLSSFSSFFFFFCVWEWERGKGGWLGISWGGSFFS